MINSIILGECLDVLSKIPDNSIDFICIDPPYGQTPLQWDKIVHFGDLWMQLKRIRKPNAAIAIFGQEPFSSYLRLSNIDEFKYDFYWVKERLTNVFQVKRRPGKVVETISVFYKDQPTYNPQKSAHLGKLVTNKIGETARWSETMAGKMPNSKPLEYFDDGTRHPTQVLRINRDNSRKSIHPTQKPVELLEYLIKTFSNKNDLVLDCFSGSGSLCIAARNTGRNFIAVENEEKYYKASVERLKI